MKMQENIILNTDSYKTGHWRLYPPGTEHVYCYVEARSDEVWDQTLFFGLQAFLLQYLDGRRVFHDDIDEAEEVLTAHGEPFNRHGWEYIATQHSGRLPVVIKAVPEGTVLPVRNVLLTIENTDPVCYWLPTYLETMLLRAVWYPTTVATNSCHCKHIIRAWLENTADDAAALLPFKLHDFGARGVSSEESAAIGGMAHLVNFQGTDTLSAILAARRYYDAKMAGVSIPATEHSTIITWGRAHERDAYANFMKQYLGPGKVAACVSDSYDLSNAIREIWGGTLKEQVLTSGGTLVIRPDSGDPDTVVRQSLDVLGELFGYEHNSKGYKVLPTCVRLIQGDGINEGSIADILQLAARGGWSAENVGFGMGGGLLQKVDRDTLGFAMKASHVVVNGEGRDVWKTPIADHSKASKPGRLGLYKDGEKWATFHEGDAAAAGAADQLVEVFRDGELVNRTDFAAVRGRAA